MDANRPYLTTGMENGTNYINATFVNSYNRQNALLATQAPLPNTVADIWRLVNDHNANCIVMLNEEKDMDETCGVYWPNKVGSSVTFDPLVVTVTETNNDHPSILVRDMKLAHNSDAEIPVRQFVLHDIWPADRDLPDPVVICDLVDLVERWQQTYGEGDHTVIIHCNNGVERTGLLCACLHIVQKLRVEQEVDIVTSVKHVKTAKTDFISSMAQYKFLYEMVQTYIQRYDTYANFK
jgi:protein tyrosine phosphatase